MIREAQSILGCFRRVVTRARHSMPMGPASRR
jgi:hypothetical protein